MRRAIALAVGGGLVLGGAMTATGAATAATPRVRTAARTRTVVYAGYELTVPASWPVYRLDQAPATCVRYDVHAVYLGAPGIDQQCPAGLVGRTETVTVGAASGTPATAAGRAGAGQPVSATLDIQDHEVQVTLARDGRVRATVLGTYGDNLALIRHVLATVRPAPAGAAPTPATAAVARPLAITMPAQVAAQARKTRTRRGFDACTAPPMAVMKAWRRAYSVVGIYIGGVNAACDRGNLSARWIAAAAKMGWSMLPTYVGPQAPCYRYGTRISARAAAQEGAAAATNAIQDAWRYGLRPKSPIYYDMEAFAGNSACTSAVLKFLSAWTRELNVKGYVSGVYSSADSGIVAMQSSLARKQRFARPQAIWYALWNGRGTLSARRLSWPQDRRAKQYLGPHNSRIGGYTLNIDSDVVAGPVAR